MGGYQVLSRGLGDDGYDEEGYDESQCVEIFEMIWNGLVDGVIMINFYFDLGGDVEEELFDDFDMDFEEVGESDFSVIMDEDDIDEDDVQVVFDDGGIEDDDVDFIVLKL